MKSQDLAVFTKLYTAAMGVYGRDITPDAAAMAFSILMKYPLSDVKAGLHRYMSCPDGEKFAPTPQGIIKQIENVDDRFFIEFIAAVSRFGPYREPEFSDPRMADAMRAIGGWAKANRMTYEEFEEAKGRFMGAMRQSTALQDAEAIGHDSDPTKLN
jgi:hypothetical protein